MTVPFGKHKGAPVESIPTGYLEWLQTVAKRADLREAMEAGLSARHAERTGTVDSRPLAALSPDARQLAAAIVRRGFRMLASEVHLDHSGSDEGMRDLNAAHAALQRVVGTSGRAG
jgi:hypothetical protein